MTIDQDARRGDWMPSAVGLRRQRAGNREAHEHQQPADHQALHVVTGDVGADAQARVRWRPSSTPVAALAWTAP